ncbi:DUF1801 domain-containing protein [Flavobacterium sp. xlx-214]|uniref:DUF1801 domain-containing protein n=1 Tax=unclassified Flavobacterium TaxID=196869 RepID=UPI0013D2FBCE|nr:MULTISPECIES: DUF1801 domain-containing protein [unclassified Flavobacterium]MBA5792746.1 DUF1801 domain-containing protein [Flavobacterium sp. xlx-221]QMI83883.1 DUF1801 domain-containing protein [Flavobacterium sp. xlx-214]
MKTLDDFYLQQPAPIKECFLALQKIILSQDSNITHTLKYGMPFFCYKDKMFCYLWYHKKYQQPYIGIVEGNRFNEPYLIQEKRSRMKIMLFNPHQDLPIATLNNLLQKVLHLYQSGTIKTKNI